MSVNWVVRLIVAISRNDGCVSPKEYLFLKTVVMIKKSDFPKIGVILRHLQLHIDFLV